MATSSAVPVTLSRAAGALDHWAAELGEWARRLAATPYPSASVSRAADRVGTLVGRTTGHAGWTRAIAVAFEAADRRRVTTAPGLRLPDLAVADLAARLALLPKLIWGRREPFSWLFANQGGRYLRLDPRGDGRVVEVLGNLAAAKHVVVLVPGMSNDIGNYRTSLRSKATSLYDAMRQESRGEGVAVISWLGYDTPGIDGASGSTVAMVAAPTLIADVAALRGTYPTAHVTVVGHSYGSVVLGRAMRAGIGVPTAIAVGSPGMDADDRAALGSRRTTLWAAKSTTGITFRLSPFLLPVFGIRIGDPVALAPVHGEDPSAKGFGARRFPVGDISGHGEYFDPGTVSVRSIARIAVARPPG